MVTVLLFSNGLNYLVLVSGKELVLSSGHYVQLLTADTIKYPKQQLIHPAINFTYKIC